MMHEGLLADILEHPEDDTPRLILADWLEDHGEPERAEFIRVQIERAQLPRPEPYDGRRKAHRRYQALVFRELDLIGRNINPEPTGILPRYCLWCEQAGVNPAWVLVPGFGLGGDYLKLNHFRRGFLEVVTLPCQDWLAHGPELVRCQPLQRVRLSDREPYQPDWGDDRSWYWFATVPGTGTHPSPIARPCHAIPDELAVKHFVYLDGWWNGWASREDAKSALSEVCLVWAKRLPLESSAVLKRMRLRAAPAPQEALT